MNFARARGGSALLIVLGMVSFMVVSAVGFAVFMRHNRVPSSYLRRSTAARQLAKAALACAMNEIDAIVDDHGYPGDGSGGHRNDFNPRSSGYTNEVKNIWMGRVLAPYAESPSETVSTLTLEGLAYLPPPMVNDARFYSRRTPTAKWKRLDYDSGRYAFCAIDVSDYFDITRVAANRPRGSGDANLVSLAYLFEDGTHKSWGEIDPIDDFQQKMDDIASTKALVSLADYNLALKSAGCKLPSPFVEYIEQGGRNGFYGNLRSTDASNPEYLKYAIQRFVVDGRFDLPREEWFGRRTGGSGGGDQSNPFNLSDIDISKRENQPFPELLDGDSETENDYSPGRIVDIQTPFLSARTRQINPCESIALYDYLDCDDIPASVAVPTVERAPMIVGIELDPEESNLKVQLKKDEQVGEPGAPDDAGVRITKKTATFYPLFDDGKIRVNAGFAFPFKYRRDLNSKAGAYSAEAVAYMYALESGQAQGGARTCRTAIGGVMRKWPESSSSGGVAYNNGLVSAASKKETTSLPQSVKSDSDAVSGISGQFRDVQMSFEGFDGTESGFKDNGYIAKYHLRKREKMKDGVWEVLSKDPDGLEWEIDPDENGGKPEFKLNALDVASGEMRQMEAGKTYVWGLSLAVRLFDKNGKLVDMAPAHPNDDDNQPSGDFADMLAGIGRPILRFDGQGGASYEIKDGIEGYKALEEKVAGQQEGGEAPGFSSQTYLTDDPRYNFAAENWYSVQAPGGSLGEAWLGQVSCGLDDRKDNDIFMSVSNQGYLQDPGELAFLPRVSGFNPGDAELEMKPITAAATGTIPSGRNDAGNRNQMWRTYGCFGDLGDDEVDNLRLVSPVRGFRVNPFTGDEFVKLAPYLNTPYDWWAAGTNATDSVKQRMIKRDGTTDSPENALECSFSEWGTETKVKYEYMKKFADVISARLRGGGADWYETWKDLGWMEGGETSICSVDLGLPLHDVDRKFLCSYWRKCYANAQQLFIVFFRAEPVVIGGGMGDGKTPPQLGARGVAVVWRDPRDRERAPSDAPHAMRVLFYHQFD